MFSALLQIEIWKKIFSTHPNGETNESIVNKVIKQNGINPEANVSIKIIRKSKIVKNKFNIIFEVDDNTYNLFLNKRKMNIDWSLCWVYDDYGVFRCKKCCQYGHFIRDCTHKWVCPKCSGEHELKDCNSDERQCGNCEFSNQKYGLSLNTDHVT